MGAIKSARAWRQRQRPGRHQVQNRRRGQRAKDHLERAREKERTRLQQRARTRERARQGLLLSERARTAGRILLFACAGAAGLLFTQPLVQTLSSLAGRGLGSVETISVQGNVRLSSEAVAGLTGVAPGSLLADLNGLSIEDALEAHPWIREAHAMRLPPATLLVRIEERVPIAMLLDPMADGALEPTGWLVDETGTAFARSSAPATDGLPRLAGGEALAGGAPHPVLLTALDLLERLEGAEAGSITALGLGLELWLPSGEAPEGWILRRADRSFEVVLGRRPLAARFEHLRNLLAARPPVLGDAPVQIDLRFANQAVLRRIEPQQSGGDVRS